MGDLQNRLRETLARLGISEAELARRLGISQQSVNEFLKSDRRRWKYLADAAQALGTPYEWIVFGRDGHPMKPAVDEQDANMPEYAGGGAQITRLQRHPTEGMVWIAELDVRAAAGAGGFTGEVNEANEQEFVVGEFAFPRPSFAAMVGSSGDRIRICEIVGDSMVPTLFPGQRVMVDTADLAPSPPGIFFLHDGLGLVVKRVEFIMRSDPPKLRIMSDNPAYQPFELTLDEAHIQGRVVGLWQRT